MRRFVAIIDPKLERYRKKAPKYAPKDFEEFMDVLKRTPRSVLSDADRARLAAVMGIEGRRVSDVMVPKSQMVFVNEKDFLGPLTLDKLYKSGFVYFPVVNNENHVLGVIHTESLNALEIKKTDRAEKYMSTDVGYLNIDDTLEYAISEMIRTERLYFLVLNPNGELAGFLNLELVFNYLLGI